MPADSRLDSLTAFRALVAAMPGPDEAAAERARAHDAQLTKPAGALGRLEALAAWAAAWQGRHPPRADHIQIVVFAGNHGVAARGVSAYPAAVTAQMVANSRLAGRRSTSSAMCWAPASWWCPSTSTGRPRT